ncbi:FG-GAP repeat domain-containing protein [Streptomyces zhihengii]
MSGVYSPRVGLAGDQVVYGNPTRLIHGSDAATMALHTVPASGGRPAGCWTTSPLAPAPDGSLLAMGGTLAGGEGVHRIEAGAGAPLSAVLVATTGEPTAVKLLGHNVPAVADLDRNGGRLWLEWRLSRLNVEMTVTLRHTATGATDTAWLHPDNGDSHGPQRANYSWDGMIGPNRAAAPNGAWTWEMKAVPLNGVGPAVVATGSFTVTRKPAPHDFNDNGSPDLLARDTAGRLWRADTSFDPINPWLSGAGEPALVGGGWQIYNQIEAAGNLGGSSVGDLVARDAAGVLWLYQGRGNGTFAGRVRVGGGWGAYTRLAGGSDLTGDGRADLVATDKAGALWLHQGTGSTSAPFAARRKVGLGGWQAFNQITAVGNVAGGPAGDLVARDTAGVLWLYQGRGDGTFTTRVKVGGGWGAYTHLVGIGDGNRDGRADLWASSPDGGSYFYQGTGNARAPFRGRTAGTALWPTSPYNHVS